MFLNIYPHTFPPQVLPDEWKDNLMALPAISKLDGNITVKTSELLVLILRCVSNMKWRTSYLWLPALKNFVSSIKDLSLELGDHVRKFRLKWK